MPYSGAATHAMVCRLSKCVGEQWPFPLPGINDLEECQPRTDYMDITSRGPKRGMEETYSKYSSVFSPDSVSSIIAVSGFYFPLVKSILKNVFSSLTGHCSRPVYRQGDRVHSSSGGLQGGSG